MKTEHIIRIVAGTLVLISLIFGAVASPFYISGYFLWLGVFVGVNLFQSGFTKFCLLEKILNKLKIGDAQG